MENEFLRVFIAAGSNIEPEKNLARACAQIHHSWHDVVFSRAYRNVAVGFDGPDFINLVLGFTTPQPLDAVIARLHAIETQCGRPRFAPKWASRTMDLDVLLFGEPDSSEAFKTLLSHLNHERCGNAAMCLGAALWSGVNLCGTSRLTLRLTSSAPVSGLIPSAGDASSAARLP